MPFPFRACAALLPRARGLACRALFAALLLGGCAQRPEPPFAGGNPADAGAAPPPLRYRSTIGSFDHARPTDPSRWTEDHVAIDGWRQ